MFKNVASQKVELFVFDYSTGAPKTGDAANLTVYINKDDGGVTALGDTSATELSSTNAPGWYVVDVTQSESNCDKAHFTGKSSTSNVVVIGRVIDTRPANAGLLFIDSNGRVDTIKIAGTTQTGRDLGASVLLSPGTGTGQVNLSSGKVSVVQLTGTDFAASTGLVPIAQGTAQGGSGTTIQLAAALSFGDNILNGAIVNIQSGTGAGQSRVITGYTGSTDTATVDSAWTTNPDNTSVYAIYPGSPYSLPTAVQIRTEIDSNSTQLAKLGSPASSISADIAAAKVDTAAIKTKTDQLTFSSSMLEANVKKVNATTINGNGSSTPWGP